MTATADTTVLVCRGCCCGSAHKHPEVDHDGQLEVLAAAAASGSARLRVTECLGCCEHSNVVVVRAGTERRWFGQLLSTGAVNHLAQWIAAGCASPVPDDLAVHQFEPNDGPTVVARPVDADPDMVARVVRHLLAAGGTWSMGVPGAVADSGRRDGESILGLAGPTVHATTIGGALRLRLTAATALFLLGGPDAVVLAIVAVRRDTLATPASRLTARGPDGDAIRGDDASARLYDLGIGHPSTAFCVRTADPELKEALDAATGVTWPDLLDSETGRLVVSRSPARVIETGAGRAEVTSPIPPREGESPAGAHTHLDPALLELGVELPVGIVLPDGWAPGAVLQPAPGWRPPRWAHW